MGRLEADRQAGFDMQEELTPVARPAVKRGARGCHSTLPDFTRLEVSHRDFSIAETRYEVTAH